MTDRTRARRRPAGDAAHAAPAAPDTPATERSTRAQDTRRAILQAAVVVFSERGFDGAITRDIAERAGVGHSLLLYHFKSKEVLWHEAVTWLREAYDPQVRVIDEAGKGQPAARQLWAIIQAFVHFSARHPEFHRIMLFEGRTANHRLDWMMERFLARTHARYKRLIAAGQRAGTVRRGDVARLRYAILALGTMPVCIPAHFERLTGRDVNNKAELQRTLELIKALVFTVDPDTL